jgi:branched-chain amino acid transport system permease protein
MSAPARKPALPLLLRSLAGLWTGWLEATGWRGRILLAAALSALASLPAWSGAPPMHAVIAVLWLAYAAQAWNLLAGFTGLFSLGHALFIGLAAWIAALFALHGPLAAGAGALLAVPAAALAGFAAGLLGCRTGGPGVRFALVTLLLAETARLGAAGFAPAVLPPLAHPSGKPVLFYYVILAMTLLALVAIPVLLRSRLGRHWLALREDPDAAAACGIDPVRCRVIAATVGAAAAAPAGVFLALYLRQAGPDLLSPTLSFQVILAAAVGGIGTLIGPVLGAFLVVPADLGLSWLIAHAPGRDLSLLRPLAAGLALMAVAAAAPGGLWPGLARLLGLLRPPPAAEEGKEEEKP